MSNQPKFDTKAFLKANWPDAAHLRAWLATYGVEVEKQTAYKWVARESIPATHLALILALLELERGAPVSLAKFLK